MKKQRQKRKTTTLSLLFYKEVFMSLLAVLSVALLVYEFVGHPDAQTKQTIYHFDIAVALIFLIDFCYAVLTAPDKAKYIYQNWYLLIAAIPIVDSWTEIFRALRILELVRVVRAGSHLTYVYETVKPKK